MTKCETDWCRYHADFLLEYYGIRGTIKAWIESYLFYLSQFVEIFKTDNRQRNEQIHKSSHKEIKHGVPQGSVWDLFVFIIY